MTVVSRHFLVLACAASLLGVPATAGLRITGILDANPTEAFPGEGLVLYKSLEFYADTAVSGAELTKYAVRRFANADPGSATLFQLNPTASSSLFLQAEEYGWAVVDKLAFQELYLGGGLGGQNWALNTGQYSAPYPRILVENAGLTTTGGNEVYQLLYYPSGFGVGNPFNVVDTFGALSDPNASSGSGSWAWNYDLSYAYRINGTPARGTGFQSTDWMYGGPGLFADDPVDPSDGFDFEQTAAIVPFGTFTAVPEPDAFALFALGLGWLIRRRGARPVPLR
jgi:hypothetical protein